MRRAGKIASIGFQRAIDSIKEGVLPNEVIGRVHHAMYEAGQTDAIIPVIVITPGPRGGRMHDISITDSINKNDLVTIELFGTYYQYQVAARKAGAVKADHSQSKNYN